MLDENGQPDPKGKLVSDTWVWFSKNRSLILHKVQPHEGLVEIPGEGPWCTACNTGPFWGIFKGLGMTDWLKAACITQQVLLK